MNDLSVREKWALLFVSSSSPVQPVLVENSKNVKSQTGPFGANNTGLDLYILLKYLSIICPAETPNKSSSTGLNL